MAKHGLPRQARLLTKSDFAALREASERVATRLFVAEFRDNSTDCARLGIAISRRVSKLAVVRNRLRRLIRESFRLHRGDLPKLDVLLIARQQAAASTSPPLRADLLSIWRKLAERQGGGH